MDPTKIGSIIINAVTIENEIINALMIDRTGIIIDPTIIFVLFKIVEIISLLLYCNCFL